MLMMPAVVRRPYRDLMGDIMGGTLSGAAFLRRCLGTGSDCSAYRCHSLTMSATDIANTKVLDMKVVGVAVAVSVAAGVNCLSC